MTEHIAPLARLVGGMADRIDQDRRSPSRSEALGNAARVTAARAAAEGTVAGRLWDDDGAALLAADAFHAGLPRQAAVAAQARAVEEPTTVPAGDQHQPSGEPFHRAARAPRPAARAPSYRPGKPRPPPVDPHGRLPGITVGVPGARPRLSGSEARIAPLVERIRVHTS